MLNVFWTSYFIWLVNQICACYASSSITCVYREYFLDEKPRGREHLSAKVRFLHQAIPIEAFPLNLIFHLIIDFLSDMTSQKQKYHKERNHRCFAINHCVPDAQLLMLWMKLNSMHSLLLVSSVPKMLFMTTQFRLLGFLKTLVTLQVR